MYSGRLKEGRQTVHPSSHARVDTLLVSHLADYQGNTDQDRIFKD
jgi:hypothetical protein